MAVAEPAALAQTSNTPAKSTDEVARELAKGKPGHRSIQRQEKLSADVAWRGLTHTELAETLSEAAQEHVRRFGPDRPALVLRSAAEQLTVTEEKEPT